MTRRVTKRRKYLQYTPKYSTDRTARPTSRIIYSLFARGGEALRCSHRQVRGIWHLGSVLDPPRWKSPRKPKKARMKRCYGLHDSQPAESHTGPSSD
eukprot:3023477-Prymnesium_polylepis.1